MKAGRRRPGPAGTLAALALAVAGLLATTGAVRAVLPWPRAGGLAARWELFAAAADSYDLVFVGSSTVARGIVPAIVDDELAAAGLDVRSFNLGLPGATSFEVDWLVRRLVERRPRRLRWMVVGIHHWLPFHPDMEVAGTSRVVLWHDLAGIGRLLESIRRNRGPLEYKLRALGRHLRLFLWNRFAVGGGVRWVAEAVSGADTAGGLDTDVDRAVLARHRGYVPYPTDVADGFARARALARDRGDPDPYATAVAELADARPAEAVPEHYNLPALLAQIELLRSHGIEPVYLMPPIVRHQPWLAPLAARPELPLVLDYHDPEAWPELFDEDLRYDMNHVNPRGAVLFSRIVGRDLAARIERLGDAR